MHRECRERFPPPPRVSDPDMHHGTCVTYCDVPWCMPGSPTSGFLWSRWRGKRSWYSRRTCNPQSYVSGKRPIHRIGRIRDNRNWGNRNRGNRNQAIQGNRNQAIGSWGGHSALFVEGWGHSPPVYLLFDAYWYRQPMVFRRLTSLLFNYAAGLISLSALLFFSFSLSSLYPSSPVRNEHLKIKALDDDMG